MDQPLVIVCNKCGVDHLGHAGDYWEYRGYDAWCFNCQGPTIKTDASFDATARRIYTR